MKTIKVGLNRKFAVSIIKYLLFHKHKEVHHIVTDNYDIILCFINDYKRKDN